MTAVARRGRRRSPRAPDRGVALEAARRRGRHRRPQAGRRGGTADHGGGRGLVAVPALVRLAAAVRAGLRHLQRHRGALLPSVLRAVPGLPGLSGLRVLAARSRAARRLAAGRARDRCRALSRRLLWRDRHAARPADDARHRHVGRRHRAAARGLAPRRRPVDAGHLDRHAGLCVPRALPARADVAQGRLDRPRRLAILADVGGRVRRRARRLDQFHLPVRAVRRAAREGRRRQLLHPARLLAARHLRGGPAKAGRRRPRA